MQFIYNTGIRTLKTAMVLATPFQSKIKKGIQGRKNTFHEIPAKKGEDWVWVHCSSLGEFEQGRPVIEQLKKEYPHYKIALSFFSPSGYEVRKNYDLADWVFYIPLDTPEKAKAFAEVFQPKLWILVKYDYWYNLLQEMHKKGVPIIVISAIFREKQIYFKPYGKWFADQLKRCISHFFVQDKNSETLLNQKGISQVSVVGDTRFDRVQTIAKTLSPPQELIDFKGNHHLIVIGSSWKDDENLWVSYLNQNFPSGWKVIIAPHEIHAKSIEELQQRFTSKTGRYTTHDFQSCDILILDTIGILSQVYALADIAYVGGGFNSSGVHNTLEPAVFGVPIMIGPHYKKFNEVKLLKEKGLIFPIQNDTEFSSTLTPLIKEDRSRFKEIAHAFFAQNTGATDKITAWFRRILD